MAAIKTVLMSGTRTGCSYAESMKSSPFSDLVLAVTGPDRHAGRGRKRKTPELACFCESSRLEVFQTDDVNSPESVKKIKSFEASAALVVDFGQILSEETLSIFPAGCFNIHYSLLPDLRGASPVRYSLLRGDKETGITVIKMNKEIDAGEIVFKKPIAIGPGENYGSLKEKMTEEGVKLTEKIFQYLSEEKELPLLPQDRSGVTRAPKIDKKFCRLDFSRPAQDIVNRVRALSPVPGCWAVLEKKGLRIKILEARVSETPCKDDYGPGWVIESGKKTFKVRAGRGSIEILRLQSSGGRVMDSSSFLAGNRIEPGDVFS